MRLFLNAVAAKGGGGITYLGAFLKHAAGLKPDWEFVVLLPRATASAIQPLPINVRLVREEIGYAPWWRRLWWEQVTLRRAVRREKPEALFSTANFGMFACPVPQLLLIQNALYFSADFENQFVRQYEFPDRLSFRLRRWLICRSVRSADVVLTPTETALNDLRRYTFTAPGKSLVNPFGQDRAGSAVRVPAPDSSVRLLYVSYYRAHKNLATLLKALRELARAGERAYRLITTLNPDTGDGLWAVTSPEDRALMNDPMIRPALEVAGPCTPAEALKLYERGDIFVFPSMVESFGFPLVEAMARGIPIIASDTPVSREVCGEAAIYFPVSDEQALAAQIERVAGDPDLRNALGNAGAERVRAQFTWEGHVRRVLDAVSELVARRGNSG